MQPVGSFIELTCESVVLSSKKNQQRLGKIPAWVAVKWQRWSIPLGDQDTGYYNRGEQGAEAGGLLRSDYAVDCKCQSPETMTFLWLSVPACVFIPAGGEERDVEQTPEGQQDHHSLLIFQKYF